MADRGLTHRVGEVVRELDPGCFAFVIATGIVSVAVHQQGLESVAWALFRLNEISYGLLWLLTLARLWRWLPLVGDDLRDPIRGPGFLTVVAATSILGGQFALLGGAHEAAAVLWWVAAVLWFLLSYAFLAGVITAEVKPGLAEGLHGGWLLLVVATQSISALGAILAGPPGLAGEPILFVALVLHLIGLLLYLLLIALLFSRLVFLQLAPEELAAPYWINMGAAAITALAGATLVLRAPRSQLLAQVLPFLTGLSFFSWAAGCWWIPLLLCLYAWRHVRKGVRIAYNLSAWSIVFPLGMYAVSTFQLGKATGLGFLDAVSHVGAWVAVLAWAATSLGFVASRIRNGGAVATPRDP